MLLAARGAFLAARRKPKLPYDAEVEYLESTGTQWIDTGVIGVSSLHVESSCALMYMTSGYSAMWGARRSSRNNDFQVYYNQATRGGDPSSIILRTGGSQQEVTASSIGISGSLISQRLDIITYSGKIYVNGFESSTPVFSFTTPAAIVLFGQRQPNGIFNLGSFRYYRWAVYDNGEKLRDLIPVRFTNELGQSEGAMYDRLGIGGMNPDGSPRTDGLYRNRGTGAFLYGADKKGWTNPYVTDGLVAMWDGEWNAGGGVHEDTSACVDLVGDKNLVNGTGHGADWVSFPATTIIYSDDLSGGSTIELVLGNMSNAENRLWLAVGSIWGYGMFQNSSRLGGYYIRCGYSSYGGWNLFVKDGYKISACALTQYDSNKHDFYDFGVAVRNGVANPTLADDTCTSSRPLQITNDPIALYSLRIYNRVLSAAEIAANYAVDKARFNLP